MEFLANAAYSSETGKFYWASIVSFDDSDICNKPQLKVYSAEHLREVYDTMSPMGFKYDADNDSLISDTDARTLLKDDVLGYIAEGLKTESGKIPDCGKTDIVDIVMWGVKYGAFVCPNWSSVVENGEECILVPMLKFKVSNSSFNIYSPYMTKDETFATVNLLNPQNGSAQVFALFVPKESVQEFELLNNEQIDGAILNLGERTVDKQEYSVYSVTVGLAGSPCNFGEGFTNFLAYSDALAYAGCKIIDKFSKLGLPEEAKPVAAEAQKAQTMRLPRDNVKITHEYHNKIYIKPVLQVITSQEKLQELLKNIPAAALTATFIESILWSDAYQTTLRKEKDSPDVVESALRAGAIAMATPIRASALMNACILLEVRYFLRKCGKVSAPLGSIIRGGGVPGVSVIK